MGCVCLRQKKSFPLHYIRLIAYFLCICLFEIGGCQRYKYKKLPYESFSIVKYNVEVNVIKMRNIKLNQVIALMGSEGACKMDLLFDKDV